MPPLQTRYLFFSVVHCYSVEQVSLFGCLLHVCFAVEWRKTHSEFLCVHMFLFDDECIIWNIISRNRMFVFQFLVTKYEVYFDSPYLSTFYSSPVRVGFVVDKVAWRHVFLPLLQSSSFNIIPSQAPYSYFIRLLSTLSNLRNWQRLYNKSCH